MACAKSDDGNQSPNHLKQESPRSIISSNISNNIQIENPTHNPMEPPRAEIKVTSEYLKISFYRNSINSSFEENT